MESLMVVPRARHADFLFTAVDAWFERLPNDRALWIELDTGRRIVEWLEAAAADDPALLSDPLKSRVEQTLGRLVTLGVPEAHELEQRIAGGGSLTSGEQNRRRRTNSQGRMDPQTP